MNRLASVGMKVAKTERQAERLTSGEGTRYGSRGGPLDMKSVALFGTEKVDQAIS